MRLTVLEVFSSFCVLTGAKTPIFEGSSSAKPLAQLKRKYYKTETKQKPTKRTTLNWEIFLLAFSANLLERLFIDLKTVYD